MRKRESWKDSSKSDWGTWLEGDQVLTRENIVAGAIMRIADATEAMSKNYLNLLSDVKYYKERAEYYAKENEKLRRRNAGLRSWNKRIKKEKTNELKQH